MPNTDLKSMWCNTFRRIMPGAVLLVGACVGGASDPTGGPARLVLVTPLSPTAESGVPMTVQPIVQAVDVQGNDVAAQGILVTASIASGGPALGGTTAIRTNAAGRAIFTDLALSGPVGDRTLRFSAEGLSSAVTGAISLSAGPLATATIAAGNNQTVAAGTAVPVPPAVRVSDAAGNPLSGIEVTFQVASGGGTLEGGSPVTNAAGVAAAERWTLGTVVGANSLTVEVNGLAGSLTIVATGVTGPAATLTLIEGDGQTATIGALLPTQPAVRVADAFGNLITGLAVTFTPSPGGAVSSATGITDASGVARAQGWRLSLIPGDNTLTASRQGAAPTIFGATGVDFAATHTAAGSAHSCSVGPGGTHCWGNNSAGQLGHGGTAPDSIPVLVSGGHVFTQVVAGAVHSCGLTAAGAAFCWGSNGLGQLGAGGIPGQTTPASVSGSHVFTQLAAGLQHTCGLRMDGALLCWGSGGNGRLGIGSTTNRNQPNTVSGGHTFAAVAAGAAHTCGVRTDGVILCWGAGANGRLGNGATEDRTTPVEIAGGGTWLAVAAGGSHTCAVATDGAAFCWGLGSNGQLGTGTAAEHTVPAAVSGARVFTTIAAGSSHTCALDGPGDAWCWGANGSGRLGDGTTTARGVPTRVAVSAIAFTVISPGAEHTCATTALDGAVCWGRNAEGQLGDGTRTVRAVVAGVKRP